MESIKKNVRYKYIMANILKKLLPSFLLLFILAVSSFASLDVFIQDQTTTPVDYFFTQIKGIPTRVARDISMNDYNVIAASVANCAIGDYLGMFNSDNSTQNRAFFANILNIVGTNITLDTPSDFAFNSGDILACFSRELNVNGSTTAQTFKVQVGIGAAQCIDINRIIISMKTDTAVDLNKFGDLPSLTKGLVLRRMNGFSVNIFNVKNNGEIANLCYDYTPYSASDPSQALDGAKFRYTLNGQDNHGVAVRLCPGESLDLVIQDDLTDLEEFRVIAEGQFVDDTERDSVDIRNISDDSMMPLVIILAIALMVGGLLWITSMMDEEHFIYKMLIYIVILILFVIAGATVSGTATGLVLYNLSLWLIPITFIYILIYLFYKYYAKKY